MIYNPDPLVKKVNYGEMSIGSAQDAAVFEVVRRASDLGKHKLWSENWWGRRLQHHTAT